MSMMLASFFACGQQPVPVYSIWRTDNGGKGMRPRAVGTESGAPGIRPFGIIAFLTLGRTRCASVATVTPACSGLPQSGVML